MVDIEADGPIPGDYSMVSIGAVIVEASLKKTFLGKLRPISTSWIEEALAISGITREEHLTYDDPKTVMISFADWIKEHSKGSPIFIADNNGFDWMWVCWYFHHFTRKNPFGFSSQNLGSLYKGLVRDTRQNFKHLRKTAHTHNPVDDAIGNAEALLQLKEIFGLAIELE